ncbi:MAG: thiamine phosphate synthase [Proteobacteria bacterium]|nr:thiamine phosphate synthase [Pseudomonadota bacterium]
MNTPAKPNLSYDFGFYGILTDPLVGYERLAAEMVERRVRFIQLRIKDRPRQEVLSIARSLRSIIAREQESFFIVNDDPRTAAEVGADGVHLGQDDMSFREARAIVGPNAIIGLSTHNPEQTLAACKLNPDYIGVGPVFATPTKKQPDPVIGLDGMKEMLALATVPAVVLGGIDHSNVARVLEGGAKNISAVRCINKSEKPADELDRMIQTIRKGGQALRLATFHT